MIDWILTYALHSTLAALALLLALPLLARRGGSPAVRVVLLRAALLGPILTATAAGLAPAAWPGSPSLSWPEAATAGPVIALPAEGALVGEAWVRSSSGSEGSDASALPSPGSSPNSLQGLASLVLGALPWLAALAACAALLRIAYRSGRVRARMLRRRLLEDPTVAAAASALRGAPVRVTECDGLSSPLALGLGEVVLPPGVLDGLTENERDALLAHEVAHLARRDTLWSGVTRLAAAATVAQPLQALLLRKLEDETELAADAWAVSRTRRPLELARCLEHVGARLLPRGARREPAALGSVAMARRSSSLVRRVEELCRAEVDAAAPRTRAATLACVALVAVAACGAPAVRGSEIERDAAEARDAGAPLGGDEAYELLRSDLLEELEPRLHVEADRSASGGARIRSAGIEFDGVEALELFFRRLHAEREDVRIAIRPSADVSRDTAEDLVHAAILAGFSYIDLSGSRGYPEPEEFVIEDHDESPVEPVDTPPAAAGERHVGPFVVTAASGPDAEDGERRFALRLDEHGGVERLPDGGPFDTSWVLDHLRGEMRRGPVEGTDLIALQDRVLIEGHADTPFGFAQAWLARLALPDVLAYRTEIALVGEEPVSVFLPHDAEWVTEEVEMGTEDAPREGPVEVRVARDGSRAIYTSGSLRSMDSEQAAQHALQLAARQLPANLVIVSPEREATFADVVPLIRTLRAGGALVAFTGAIGFEPMKTRGVGR